MAEQKNRAPAHEADVRPEPIDVTQLMERYRQTEIIFHDQIYRLTLTRNQKLILTK
ncbi:MAG: hemin uptake protein HemP [Lysobacterales bacterium]